MDELSSFKNWQSKRFRFFMKVRTKVKRVVDLTGIPSSNGMMDLFTEFKCLDMTERLGRFFSQYRVDYFVSDRMNGGITVANAATLTGKLIQMANHHHNVKTITEDRYVEYHF